MSTTRTLQIYDFYQLGIGQVGFLRKFNTSPFFILEENKRPKSSSPIKKQMPSCKRQPSFELNNEISLVYFLKTNENQSN